MEKNELLEICRYYKGEESNPFDGVDNDKSTLWFYERIWVEKMLNDDLLLNTNIEEYIAYGYGAMSVHQPIPFVAMLMNRYYHQDGYIPQYSHNNDFEVFYSKMYD